MTLLKRVVMCSVFACFFGPPVQAGKPVDPWTQVGSGIHYRRYDKTINLGTRRAPNYQPQVLHVARMTVNDTSATIETGKGPDVLPGFGGETATVLEQAQLYDEAINGWGDGSTNYYYGKRNNVVVAINGSGFDPWSGVMASGYIHSGSYDIPFDNFGSGIFFWKYDRTGTILDNVYHSADKQQVEFTGFGTLKLDGINDYTFFNDAGPSEWLVAFTPEFGYTPYDYSGYNQIFVVVELLDGVNKPLVIIPPGTGSCAHGIVKEVTPYVPEIPFGHVVLQATGSKSSTIQGYNLQPGSPLCVNMQLVATGFEATKTYAALAAWKVLLNNGTVVAPAPGSSEDPVREARTAVAVTNSGTSTTYVYFVVCDRDTQNNPMTSIGMFQTELAEFCRVDLGANYAVNQDGGPSSQMVVNGSLINTPDREVPPFTWPRPVANSLMMVNLQPKARSFAFGVGDTAHPTGAMYAWAGPGTNYAAGRYVSDIDVGMIQDTDCTGVYAKGSYWWPLLTSGYSTPVWLRTQDLVMDNPGPNSLVHPSPDTLYSVCYNWVYHYTGGYNNGFWAENGPTTPNMDPCESDALWEYYPLPETGVYDLYLWWPAEGSQYCTRTEVWIWSYDDTKPVYRYEANQSINSQRWVWMGSATLDNSVSWNVHMETDSYDVGKTVQAAACMLRLRPGSSGASAAGQLAAAESDLPVEDGAPVPYTGSTESFRR